MRGAIKPSSFQRDSNFRKRRQSNEDRIAPLATLATQMLCLGKIVDYFGRYVSRIVPDDNVEFRSFWQLETARVASVIPLTW